MRALLLWLTTCLALSAGGQRIASYSPGATQTLLDLGCSAEIVMATRWCPLPKDHPAARDADVFLPDLERLLRTKPDLVVLPRMANPLWAEKCAQAGLRTVVLQPEARDAVARDIRLLGEATGRMNEAARLANALTRRPAQRAKTIVVVWDGVMAGPESYLAEPLAAAGFVSALGHGSWIKFDWELLAAAKPDAVLWLQNASADGTIRKDAAKLAEMARLPAVKSLTCVNNRHVYETNSGSKWLPGSGLLKISQDLQSIHEDLAR
jgi:ABC-type Fe3+-hydroxamate transport system substrate-binding protein